MENRSYLSIKQWADDDKPREKLMLKGKSVLSDAELLAILISSGSRSESAVELSKRILSEIGSLQSLGKMSVKQLMTFKGIGLAKAITIIAALEMGRRRGDEDVSLSTKITSSKSAYDTFKPLIADLLHEEFWILFLNNSNNILYKCQISKGGITGTVVDVRIIFKIALEYNATAIILAHNHPSGTIRPSDADQQITKKIKEAGKNIDIQVLDHLIISESGYYSFADEGQL